MATGSWSDGGNTFTTQHNVPRDGGGRGSGAGGGYEPPGGDLMNKLLRKRLLEALGKKGSGQSQTGVSLGRPQVTTARRSGGSGGGGMGSSGGGGSALEKIQLENAKFELAEKKRVAAEGQRGAPMKQLSGFNLSGPTMDVNAMTATQRQLFLPQGSSGSEGTDVKMRAATEDAENRRYSDWMWEQYMQQFGGGAAAQKISPQGEAKG